MAVLSLLHSTLSSSTSWLILATALVLYLGRLGFWRLYRSPVAHIPGSRLAALTWWYEFYYDIILGGQYTFKIIEMHKKYGPIIRINPYEVHISDPEFFPELYTGPSRRRQKWTFFTQQFGADQAALSTIDHDLHKLRRGALNPFFSIQNVRRLQPLTEERVDALLDRFRDHAQTSTEPLSLMYPFSAFTGDVITKYCFARSDHLVDDPNFGREVTDSLHAGTHMGNTIKHMKWTLTLVNSLPDSFSGKFVPGWGGFLKMKKVILKQIAQIQATANTEKWALDVSHPTIFHEMLSSKSLLPHEKSVTRLSQEGQILLQGGTLTTSWVLSIATFHLLSKPEYLSKLRDELFAAIPDPDSVVPLAELEQLPYLRSVVKESVRLGFGSSAHLARIAPDETLVFHDKEHQKTWHIPPGTPVAMTPYQILTDESIYYDPFGFHPERWVQDQYLDKYLVCFGAGTRICLGKNLALAEMYLVLAKLFRRWGGEGDRRPKDFGVMKIYETTVKDCEMAADYFIPIPYKGSKGIRVIFECTRSEREKRGRQEVNSRK